MPNETYFNYFPQEVRERGVALLVMEVFSETGKRLGTRFESDRMEEKACERLAIDMNRELLKQGRHISDYTTRKKPAQAGARKQRIA